MYTFLKNKHIFIVTSIHTNILKIHISSIYLVGIAELLTQFLIQQLYYVIFIAALGSFSLALEEVLCGSDCEDVMAN